MPLVYQHTVNDTTRLGIWQLAEKDDFFLRRVPPAPQVSHPHKRLQHLAGRYLLTCLFPDFPLSEILVASTRKPFLENEAYHFSISHSGDYAAAMVSSSQRVGIDLENITGRIERVQHRFLSGAELSMLGIAAGRPADLAPGDYNWQSWLTLAWCAKEALFKWDGEGLIDFREHLQLAAVPEQTSPVDYAMPFLMPARVRGQMAVTGKAFPEFMLAWVCT